MPIKVIILLAYGVGLVMGFVIARLYPKGSMAAHPLYSMIAFLIYIASFVVGYLLGLLYGLI